MPRQGRALLSRPESRESIRVNTRRTLAAAARRVATVSRAVRSRAVLLAELLLAMTLVVACGTDLPHVPLAPLGNDPVPLPDDLKILLEASIRPSMLQPADGTSPPISASKALQIAGVALLDQLAANNVPAQDAPAPDGLVRRVFIDRGPRGARPPTSAWVVAYRFNFNCHDPGGGPGPCAATSFYFVDDRTGEIFYSAGT